MKNLIYILLILFLFILPAYTLGAALDTIKIAYPAVSLSYFPIIVAEKKGLFLDEGLKPIFIQIKTDIAVAGLISGEVDYTTAFSSVIRGAAMGTGVKAFMALVSRPQHVLVVNDRIKQPSELVGKRIAVNELGGAQHFEAKAVIEKYRIPEKDVAIIAIVGEANRLASMQVGSIDANVMSVPWDIKAEKLGFRRLIFLSDILEFSHAGLGTSAKKIKENPSQVKKVIKSALKGISYTRKNTEDTINIMKGWLKMDDDTARKAYEVGLRTWSEDGIATELGLKFDIEIVKKSTGKKEDIPIDKLIDYKILKEALKELRFKE